MESWKVADIRLLHNPIELYVCVCVCAGVECLFKWELNINGFDSVLFHFIYKRMWNHFICKWSFFTEPTYGKYTIF